MMPKLSFRLDFKSHELRGLDLPLEVRRANLAPVGRPLASQSLSVEPGTYYVQARLPAGQELLRRVEVGEEDVAVTLRPEPEEASPHEWQERAFYVEGPAAAAPPAPRSRPVTRRSPPPPRREKRESRWRDYGDLGDELPAAGGPKTGKGGLGLPAQGDDVDEVDAYRLPDLPGGVIWEERDYAAPGAEEEDAGGEPGVALRLFAGNLLAGPPRELPARELLAAQAGAGASAELRLTGGEASIAQLLQGGVPPLNLVLPPLPGEHRHLLSLAVRSAGDRWTLEWSPRHPTAALLLRYARRGALREAALSTRSETMAAEGLVREKEGDPVAAVLGAYALLRFGELDRLHDWTANLRDWFPWLSDAAAIRGEHLARLGRHGEAAAVFLEVPDRGLPACTEGLVYTLDRLRLYARLGEGSARKMPADPEALRAAAARLAPFAAAADLKQPLLLYPGPDPSRPSIPGDPPDADLALALDEVLS